MRLLAAALLAVLPSAADAEELAPGKAAALRAAVERLGALRADGLTAEEVWSFELPEFATDDAAPDALPEAELAAEVREALRHVCRTAYLRRGPLGRLGQAREICYRLGSPRVDDWLCASRLLRHEPLGAELDRAAMALVRDERPEVRRIAGDLAADLVVFGRNDAGLMDTVLACLMDPNPNVVAMFSFRALATRDKRVIDRLVACVSDDRPFDRRASPVLNMGTATNLRDWLQPTLCWTFWHERRARCKWEPPRFDANGNELPSHEPVYVVLSPDEIRAWWKENREAFGFQTPASHWRCVLDQVLVVDVGRRLTVFDSEGTPLKIDIRRYRDGWLADGPSITIDGEINNEVFGEDQHLVALDGACDGTFQVAGTWGNGRTYGQMHCRGTFLPTDRPDRVRLKLTMHIGHLER